jgi:hypothetical protein
METHAKINQLHALMAKKDSAFGVNPEEFYTLTQKKWMFLSEAQAAYSAYFLRKASVARNSNQRTFHIVIGFIGDRGASQHRHLHGFCLPHTEFFTCAGA